MHKTTRAVLTSIVVGAALTAAPALYAQTTQAPANPTEGRKMMGDTAGMMGNMSEMTEACTKMMQSMHQPGKGEDQHKTNPPADSDRKG